MRRNLIIADLFHRMGKVERMGSGINKMKNLMREAGLKSPVFESDNFFRAIFYRNSEYALKFASEKMGVERSEKRVGEKLSRNQQKIIELILNEPTISAKKLSELVGISSRKIEVNISKLKDKGLLQRIGSDKGGHWKIIEK